MSSAGDHSESWTGAHTAQLLNSDTVGVAITDIAGRIVESNQIFGALGAPFGGAEALATAIETATREARKPALISPPPETGGRTRIACCAIGVPSKGDILFAAELTAVEEPAQLQTLVR